MTREGLRSGTSPTKFPDVKKNLSPNGNVTKSNVMNKLDDISVKPFNFHTSNNEGQHGNNIIEFKRYAE